MHFFQPNDVLEISFIKYQDNYMMSTGINANLIDSVALTQKQVTISQMFCGRYILFGS